jgi:hypothetical protein
MRMFSAVVPASASTGSISMNGSSPVGMKGLCWM